MVISHKHKYVFVGIPFSASSSITKELITNYQGESILNKHSNIQTLIKETNININDYIVFGVYRSPHKILISRYNKRRNNPDNRFTDPKFLIENGGHVSKKAQKMSKLIREGNLSFAQFMNLSFHIVPYDNEFTMNAPFFNFIIDFDNLESDFIKVLNLIGLEPGKKLNKINITNKRDDFSYQLSDSFHSKYFAPFLHYNSKYIPRYIKQKPNVFFYLIFLFLRKIREYIFLNSKKNPKYL